jgi:hypothetical protein
MVGFLGMINSRGSERVTRLMFVMPPFTVILTGLCESSTAYPIELGSPGINEQTEMPVK